MSETLLDNLENAIKHFIKERSSLTNEIIAADVIMGKAKYLNQDPGRICYILTKTFTNSLGIGDSVVYYVIFRPEFFKGWSAERLANIPSRKGTTGITIDLGIVMSIARDMQAGRLACFAVVTGNGAIHYMPGDKLLKLQSKYGYFTDERKNTDEVGLGEIDFLTTDPYV